MYKYEYGSDVYKYDGKITKFNPVPTFMKDAQCAK